MTFRNWNGVRGQTWCAWPRCADDRSADAGATGSGASPLHAVAPSRDGGDSRAGASAAPSAVGPPAGIAPGEDAQWGARLRRDVKTRAGAGASASAASPPGAGRPAADAGGRCAGARSPWSAANPPPGSAREPATLHAPATLFAQSLDRIKSAKCAAWCVSSKVVVFAKCRVAALPCSRRSISELTIELKCLHEVLMSMS